MFYVLCSPPGSALFGDDKSENWVSVAQAEGFDCCLRVCCFLWHFCDKNMWHYDMWQKNKQKTFLSFVWLLSCAATAFHACMFFFPASDPSRIDLCADWRCPFVWNRCLLWLVKKRGNCLQGWWFYTMPRLLVQNKWGHNEKNNKKSSAFLCSGPLSEVSSSFVLKCHCRERVSTFWGTKTIILPTVEE